MLLPGDDRLTPALVDEVADELNVKRVEPIVDLGGLFEHTVVPNFRALGPRLGPLMPKVKEALASVDSAAVASAFDEGATYRLDVDGTTIELGPDDVEVRAVAHEELVLTEDAGYAVALDTTLDDELRREGAARELVRAINDLRKTLDLALSDRIRVAVYTDDAFAGAAAEHGDWIANEVLAVEWRVSPPADAPAEVHTIEIDGERVHVALHVA